MLQRAHNYDTLVDGATHFRIKLKDEDEFDVWPIQDADTMLVNSLSMDFYARPKIELI